jgi:excisionase family DNA binding protein
MIEPLTYSVGEAAKAIGMSRTSTYELIRRDELPTIRIGKRVLVSKASVREFVGLPPEENARPSAVEKDEPEESTYLITVRRVKK